MNKTELEFFSIFGAKSYRQNIKILTIHRSPALGVIKKTEIKSKFDHVCKLRNNSTMNDRVAFQQQHQCLRVRVSVTDGEYLDQDL